MKQKDILTIVVVVIVSAIVALFISNKLIASPKNRSQQVEVIQSINTNFPSPDSSFYGNSAVDPTQIITIGPNSNQNPFNSPSSQ